MTDIERARAVMAGAARPIVPLRTAGRRGWPEPMPQDYEGMFEARDLDAICLAMNVMPAMLDLLEATQAMDLECLGGVYEETGEKWPSGLPMTRRVGNCVADLCAECRTARALAAAEAALRAEVER